MTKSLAQLKKEIARLEAQADAIKKKEVAGIVARVKEAIAHYGLTAADLGLAGPAREVVAKKPRKARKPGARKSAPAIKYRDGAGNTWSGRGRRPRWYLDAIASGKTPEQLAA